MKYALDYSSSCDRFLPLTSRPDILRRTRGSGSIRRITGSAPTNRTIQTAITFVSFVFFVVKKVCPIKHTAKLPSDVGFAVAATAIPLRCQSDSLFVDEGHVVWNVVDGAFQHGFQSHRAVFGMNAGSLKVFDVTVL